jgi:hypothetical protein
MLRSTLAPETSLIAYRIAAGSNSLTLACIWRPVAVALILSYFVFISRCYVSKFACSATISRSTKDCEHDQIGVRVESSLMVRKYELNQILVSSSVRQASLKARNKSTLPFSIIASISAGLLLG